MLESVKIARRQSEIRQSLAGLVGKDNATEDEMRNMGALDLEYRNNETRYRAALICEDTERREAGAELETRSGAEWAAMMAGFELRQVALSLDEGRALDGKTAEIVQELRSAGEAGTEEYDRMYWEIMTGKRAEGKRSWGALIDLFRQSDKWAAHSSRYRQDLEPVFAYLIEKIGKADVARLTQTDIYKAMDANTHRVRFANYIPTAISMLSKFGIRKAWRADNPAIGIEPLKVPDAKKKPHIPWPDWAVEKWRAEASPIARLIFEIGVGSVQRPGDWVGFTWGDYDGDTLKVSQNKTGVALVLPCTSALKAALNEAKAGLNFLPMPSRYILTNAYGGRMIYRTMADTMIKERKRLGLMLYDQHALRYRGVKELAWAGCDDDEIASFSGHTTKSMIAKYAGEARQTMRARQAAAKRFGTEQD